MVEIESSKRLLNLRHTIGARVCNLNEDVNEEHIDNVLQTKARDIKVGPLEIKKLLLGLRAMR